MFDQVFTYQANLTGPGTTTALGGSTKTGVQAAVDVQGFLFVPGWTSSAPPTMPSLFSHS
jgi:hypothetical protein